MGYTYRCDSCGTGYNSFPPFAGEFTETFLDTIGGRFAMGYSPGEKVTFCPDCLDLFVLSGKVVVCRRCGFKADVNDVPGRDSDCPRCEEDGLTLKEGDDHE